MSDIDSEIKILRERSHDQADAISLLQLKTSRIDSEKYCDQHMQAMSDLIVIGKTFEDIKERICKHINEGDDPGGFRDRVRDVENLIQNNIKETEVIKEILKDHKTNYALSGIIGGIIGGLFAKAAPEIVQMLLKIVIK